MIEAGLLAVTGACVVNEKARKNLVKALSNFNFAGKRINLVKVFDNLKSRLIRPRTKKADSKNAKVTSRDHDKLDVRSGTWAVPVPDVTLLEVLRFWLSSDRFSVSCAHDLTLELLLFISAWVRAHCKPGHVQILTKSRGGRPS